MNSNLKSETFAAKNIKSKTENAKNNSKTEKCKSVSKTETLKIEENFKKSFGLKLYDEVYTDNSKIGHAILQNKSLREKSASTSANLVFAEDRHNEISKLQRDLSISKDEAIEKHRNEVEKKHTKFYRKIFEQETLIQNQEKRKKVAAEEWKHLESNLDGKKCEADALLQRTLDLKEKTWRMDQTVDKFTEYKEYAQNNVERWGSEAQSVDAIFCRFRDLLTLRYELILKVKKGYAELEAVQEAEKIFIKNEKSEEGKALLKIYEQRKHLQQIRDESETVDLQFQSMKKASLELTAKLTEIRLSLSNMYSVARRFQPSLPKSEMEMGTSFILKKLFHFLQDANIVVKESRTHPETVLADRPSK